ncbi:MAG: peptidoglycan-associated lipoprotein Pal [Desulfobacterales bacterium]|nr:peptidoglycan-associated lipoprotein Pal [Desulfobacterales bacterium]
MTNRFWAGLALLLVIPGLIFTASCAKKEVKSEPAVTPATSAEEEAEARRLAKEKASQEALAAQKALEEQRLLEERLREEARQRKEREELAARHRFLKEDIHFEFDRSRLIPEAKEILRCKAEWLVAHPAVTVIIEGHCDERGTNEYNMSLGDRRAESAKSFLVDLGIAPERLTNVSYGEERPLDPGHNEEAWAKNRRAHFVID